MGKIDDFTARNLVFGNIRLISNHMNEMYPVWKTLNINQKTALISFLYNLGTDFIELKTVKMHQHMLDGNLDGVCYEMRDCDNTTVKDQSGNKIKIKCPGLTRRRQAEMKLFQTPCK